MPDDIQVIESQSDAPVVGDIESMMAQFESAREPEAPAPEAKAEAPKADASAAPKLEATPAASKPSDKPPDKAAPAPKEEATPLRRKIAELSTSEAALKKEMDSLRKQNQELSTRRLTPEIEKEMEENRKQLQTLRQEISESAYERSEAYKRDFVDPVNQAADRAIETAKQFQVFIDSDGNTRPATQADMQRLARLPVGERGPEAKKLFGDNAPTVLADIREVERLQANANSAVKNHRDQWGEKQKQDAERSQTEHRQIFERRAQAEVELAEKYPEFFGQSDDPKSNEALKAGYEFFDFASRMEEMNPVQKADYAAVVRARAAGFVRATYEKRILKTENASLKAELAKLRGSDPGGDPKLDARGEKPKDKDEVGEIDDMAERIERAASGR